MVKSIVISTICCRKPSVNCNFQDLTSSPQRIFAMLGKRCLLLTCLPVVFFVIFTMGSVSAQTQPASNPDDSNKDRYVGDSGSMKENEAAVRKLDRMSAAEIEALDKKLSQALEWFYDQKYARAYPVFQEIAEKADTMDVMFWLGTSALAVGEDQVAIQNFTKMLSIDPGLHHIRIELAKAYLAAGQKAKALQELTKVKAASPPPAILKRIEQLTAKIEASEKKYRWNLRLSQGIMYDDNINSSAGRREHKVRTGTIAGIQQLEDWASVTTINGNILYDIGAKKGLLWNTTGLFYNKSYFDHSEFNLMRMDFTTGPWWQFDRSVFRLPVGYTEIRFGNDELGHTFHVDPSYQYNFCRYFSLRGLYSFSNNNYYDGSRSGLENHYHRFELRPIFFLFKRRHMIAPYAGHSNLNADEGKYSFDGPHYGLSYFGKFPTRTELLLNYRRTHKHYDSKALPLYNRRRTDRQNIFSASVKQGLFGNFSTSFLFNYIDNDSNLELYNYHRSMYTLSVEYRF